MKKLILLVCFLFISSHGYSTLLTDDFSYSTGTLAGNGPWKVALAGANPIQVTSPGLIFPSYAGSGIGNAVTLLTNGEDDSAAFARQDTSNAITVYSSFMVNVTAAQATGDYFFCVSTSGNAFDSRVYARSVTGGFQFGMTKANEATVTYGSTVYNLNQTYLVVAKYRFISGATNDEVSLFVFDTALPFIEPLPTIGPITATSADAINLSRVIFRQGSASNAPTVVIDGINVDNIWNNTVLPVELSSFSSVINKRDVTLNWTTASESNNSEFAIERSSANSSWTNVGSVAGHGTVSTPNSYSFTDRGLATGTYNYRLKQIDYNGNFEYFNLNNEVNIGIPSKYELSQNYPNPFNPTTNINFDLPFDGNVSIKLFDMSGKEVATLVNEARTAGYYTVNFNASSLSSGVYFYSINANNFTATKKMMLLK